MNTRLTRRDVIATGCAVAVSMGLAGCSSDGTPESDEVETTEAEPAAVDAPASDFDMEYEPGASLDSNGSPWEGATHDGTLTVTHTGGDPVSADKLFIVGPPGGTLTPTPNPSITTAYDGQWYAQGQATPDEPDADVTQGDSTTIEVDADAEVWVRWESSDGRTGRGFETWTGPDA